MSGGRGMPREGRGRFFSRRCPDPNCDGVLERDDHPLLFRRWRCNGLVHVEEQAPIVACPVWHQDGGLRP